ncbi:MAG TPA: TetR/AcrR family transcriptional regulator [Candidatus Limnocylindrales bacterium]|nr:TetR/AcrR family transcriptional regulator [Candidatus Limnocylindrales bacterium]
MDVTPVTSAPARSRLQTRSRLLDSATKLFAERGLHGVTSHEIARAAGVASGTFYLHFRDKTDVYRHIVFHAIEDLVRSVQQAVGAATGNVLRQRARAEAIVTFAEANRDVIRILFSTDSEAASVEADALTSLATGLEARLRREREEGLFPADLDPVVCARAHVGMTAHLIDWWTQDPSRASRDDVIETLVRLQFLGTGAARQELKQEPKQDSRQDLKVEQS